MEAGIKGYSELEVVFENTAKALGSGLVEVFATPAMIALMENTAAESIMPYLEEGLGSVGTKLNVTHDAATPIGMTVRCESTLVEVDGRRLVFTVEAFDDAGKIGAGTHERFIIQTDKFLAKVNAKKAAAGK